MNNPSSTEPSPFPPGVPEAVEFWLDGFAKFRGAVGQDLGPTVVLLGLIWEELRRYVEVGGDLSKRPPGEVEPRRFPVSGVRLAEVVAMPYETSRRHVRHLCKSGLCERRQGGFVIPTQVLKGAEFQAFVDHAVASTARLQSTLAAQRSADHRSVRGGHIRPGRIAILYVGFILAGVTYVAHAYDWDITTALIVEAICVANFAPVTERTRGQEPLAMANGVLADHARAPVSAYKLAKIVGLPYETVRRRVTELVDAGMCQRTGDGGVIVQSAVLLSPNMVEGGRNLLRDTLQFLADAGRMGLHADANEAVPA